MHQTKMLFNFEKLFLIQIKILLTTQYFCLSTVLNINSILLLRHKLKTYICVITQDARI
jgi:hypothetical protein